MTARSYWQLSRAPRYSLLFALPLILAYEGLAVALADPEGRGVRNAADVILKRLFISLAGPVGPLLLWTCLLAVGVWLAARDARRLGDGLRASVFAGMMAEATVLALLVGGVVQALTVTLLEPLALAVPAARTLDWPTRLLVSLGAGLYEELLFRVLLVSLLAALAVHVFRWPRGVAATWAAGGSALAFAAFHYIGPYGDPLDLYSFTYRFIAGLFFSGLFVLRGFGITAWTHALYDIFLLVV